MFVGRNKEIELLESARDSQRAELIIIYGRRRIGKSTLIERVAVNKNDYFFEAIKGFQRVQQIQHFLNQLSEKTKKEYPTCRTWQKAFDQLTPYISKGTHLVVFDEFPWMASERKELVAILKFYWDRKWKNNSHFKLILCGSVANFMIKHLIHSESLHNRKTLELKINPLSPLEAQLFFRKKRSTFEICKFLMTFGGIPKYLEQINPNLSFYQNIEKLCFSRHGFFVNEYESIFKEQFKVIKKYEPIIESLTTGPKTKTELEVHTHSSSGGGFNATLDQLERAGFIVKVPSLDLEKQSHKSRTIRYKLWDEWIRFYFTYIRDNLHTIYNQDEGVLPHQIEKSLPSYFGIAFESLCMKNILTICKKMGISSQSIIKFGSYFKQASCKTGLSGAQFDICIIRKGQILTLIECKYTENPVGLEVVHEMESKISNIRIPTKYTIEKVLITASGVTPEVIKKDYFHHILGLECLFG